MLDIKYRPDSFDKFLGNKAEIESLKKQLEKKDKPHFYLFSGISGSGKTSLARIMAKELGGDDLTIKEINSSDNRGIDTAREVIESMKYRSLMGKPKIYIFDESHMTTSIFQNAMLKHLEEPPEYVYIFFCTTDPQKLIITIKTRAFYVKIKPVKQNILYKHLRRICKYENYEIDKAIIEKIIDKAEGSVRKALKLLEKIIGIKDEKNILEMIDYIEEEEKEIIDFCRILLKAQSWDQITGILKGLNNIDPEKIRYAVMGYMSSVLLNNQNNRAAVILECFSEPTYNTGKNGIILSAYQSFFDK